MIKQVNVIRDSISQGHLIDGERLPEVEQYRHIIEDIASAVLGNDESTSSDTDKSTDNDSTSVDELASASTPCSSRLILYLEKWLTR
jgi:hypothetical protein